MGRSRNTILKRQRELKKAEKAASKRAKRHGTSPEGFTEPQPTVRLGGSEDGDGSPGNADDASDS